MHLLLAIYRYTPYGGLQKDAARIIHAVLNAGHQVTVFTTDWQGAFPDGARLEKVPPSGWSNHSRMLHFSRLFLDRLKCRNFDVSLAMSRIPGADFYFAADECQRLVLPESHSWLALKCLPRYRTFLALEAETLSADFNTVIMTITRMQQDGFIKSYGMAEDRFRLLPPGMDERCFRPGNEQQALALRHDVRSNLAIPEEAVVLVIVAASFQLKGGDRLLASVASLPQQMRERIHLIIIGDHRVVPHQAAASSKIPESRIHVLGRRDDVNQLLLASDIMVHPARRESAGSALIEGLAAGLPVICTENCGFSPLVGQTADTVIPVPFRQEACNAVLKRSLDNLNALTQQVRAAVPQMDLSSRPEAVLKLLEAHVQNR